MNNFFSRRIVSALLAGAAMVLIALPASASDRHVDRRVPPIYPELARRMHIGGSVRVEATVAPDGHVVDTKTVSGNRMLAPAAEDAIKRWKFAPGDAQSTENIEVDFDANN